jgi:hypothetical protein
LPNIAKNKYKSIKFVWFIFFLVSSSVCAYLIFLSIDDFLKREIVTKIVLKEKNSLGIKIFC